MLSFYRSIPSLVWRDLVSMHRFFVFFFLPLSLPKKYHLVVVVAVSFLDMVYKAGGIDGMCVRAELCTQLIFKCL